MKEDSLYFGHFLKVVYNNDYKNGVLWKNYGNSRKNYSLKNRKLVCELRKTGTTSIVKKYEVLTTADRGSSEESCTIEYPGAGEYTLTEVYPGEGYILNDIPIKFRVIKNGEDYT